MRCRWMGADGDIKARLRPSTLLHLLFRWVSIYIFPPANKCPCLIRPCHIRVTARSPLRPFHHVRVVRGKLEANQISISWRYVHESLRHVRALLKTVSSDRHPLVPSRKEGLSVFATHDLTFSRSMICDEIFTFSTTWFRSIVPSREHPRRLFACRLISQFRAQSFKLTIAKLDGNRRWLL